MTVEHSYCQTTGDITVTVAPFFLEEQSEPEAGRFIWAYQVRIENHGRAPVRLTDRYWHIVDAQGRSQEVRGPGVVGEQPVINPGSAFEYTSGTPLGTPSGMMRGHYIMAPETGSPFAVDIPAFSLDSPHDSARIH